MDLAVPNEACPSIAGHKPLHCSSSGQGPDPWRSAYKEDEGQCGLRTNQTSVLRVGWERNQPTFGLEALFHQMGVDMNICGHVHDYERRWPTLADRVLATNYINPQTFVHVMSGVGGVEADYQVFDERSNAPCSALRINGTIAPGFGMLTIHNHTHLTFAEVNASAPAGTPDNTVDKFTIVQHRHHSRRPLKLDDDRASPCYPDTHKRCTVGGAPSSSPMKSDDGPPLESRSIQARLSRRGAREERGCVIPSQTCPMEWCWKQMMQTGRWAI